MGNNPAMRFDPDGGWDGGGDPDKPAYSVLLAEVVVTARSSWNWAVNGFNNVNWAQQWDNFQSGLPVWQSSRMSESAVYNGDYVGAMGYFGTALAEGATLGYGTLWGKPAQFALTRTSTPIVDDVVQGGGRGLVNLTEETFSQALFQGAENVAGYSVYGTKGLVGNTFNRNIFLLESSGSKSLSGFRSFVGSLETEALSAGASKISIHGSSVINKGFLNPNIAKRFGYTFKQSGSGIFLQKTLKYIYYEH